jgi:hypothetical protein
MGGRRRRRRRMMMMKSEKVSVALVWQFSREVSLLPSQGIRLTRMHVLRLDRRRIACVAKV